MNKTLKADLHIHTEYSMDCNTPLQKILTRCLEIGINCINIADHGTIEGALKMKSIAPFIVIVSEEILTLQGEVMGMFLKETIPGGLTAPETISRIKAQGGLVCIPHPFDILRRSILKGEMDDETVKQIDIIEIINARSPVGRSSMLAQEFAHRYNLPGSAGSDAHTVGEIGNAYVAMPEFEDKDDFLKALRKGRAYGHRTNPLVHFRSFWAKLRHGSHG